MDEKSTQKCKEYDETLSGLEHADFEPKSG